MTRLLQVLTTFARKNVAALRRDAKRLHKHSQQVFGVQYPLPVCLDAIAVSRGYQSWEELERVDKHSGQDTHDSPLAIASRNDFHEKVLETLLTLDFESSGRYPLVFSGPQSIAYRPALVLFFEMMAVRKLPGLLMIETQASSMHSLLCEAVTQLGLVSHLDQFRFLDLRERVLPVSLSATPDHWVNAIYSAVPHDVRTSFSGEARWYLETFSRNFALERKQVFDHRDRGNVGFFEMSAALSSLVTIREHQDWAHSVFGEQQDYAERKIKSGALRLPDDLKDCLSGLNQELNVRSFSLGPIAITEADTRPYCVLFSREDPASHVLAAVVHSYFSDKPRFPNPILYISDSNRPYAPKFLSTGEGAIIANGLPAIPSGQDLDSEDFYGYKRAEKITCQNSDGTLTYMGRTVQLPPVSA